MVQVNDHSFIAVKQDRWLFESSGDAVGSVNDNSWLWSPPSPAPRLSGDVEQDEQLTSVHYRLERE